MPLLLLYLDSNLLKHAMSRPRLLLVDDEPNLLATLALILQAHGFAVTTSATVAQALTMIASTSYFALLADLNMPGNGANVVTTMRRLQPAARVVVITGFIGPHDIPADVRAAADATFFKPLEIPALVNQLRAWLR